jgi:hypothetical protein
MHRVRPLWLVFASLALPASVVLASPDAAPFREGIEFASSQAALEQSKSATRFDFLAVRDLWVRVKVRGLPPLATLKLTFSSPNGTPFYETTLLYTTKTDPKERGGAQGGAAANALRATRIPGGFALDYPVPIAGTVFQRFPTPGGWKVEAQIESTRTSLTTPLDVSYGDP